jgi:DNA-binding LytR/AlgR family response regulator
VLTVTRLSRYFDRTIARPVLWLEHPLIGAVPWTRRLRLCALFLLLIALSSPFLHSHLGIALSPGELVVHTAIVVLAVALVMLLIEVVIAAHLRISHQENWVSAGGFLVRAAAAYLLSSLAVGPMHQVLPFTRAIMEKHVQAVQTNMSWHVLPVALLIAYIAYQVMRKHYLARQIAGLRQINHELEMARDEHRQDPGGHDTAREQTSTVISVPSNGVEISLHVESILRVQADENYCHVVADVGTDEPSRRYMVRMTLTEALALLPEELFLQTHRSHLVNLRYVTEVIRDGRHRELRLTTGERVPVSRARIGSVQSRISDFLTADWRSRSTPHQRAAHTKSSHNSFGAQNNTGSKEVS